MVLGVLAAASAGLGWYALFREVPQVLRDGSVEELFKYGSIGAEREHGLPYWLWFVLPRVFPDHLPGPGGYASFGAVWEEGRETPIGFSRKRIGFDRVAINCAFCHTATLRTSAADPIPRVFLGAASPTLDAQRYRDFLIRCAKDPRFNAREILGAIGREVRLGLFDRLLYRSVLIPATRRALVRRGEEFAWTEGRAPWGPGRVAPINPLRLRLLKLEVLDPDDYADLMPMWNLRARRGLAYHWEAQNTDLTEVFRSSALDNGATPRTIPLASLERLEAWAEDLPPPPYPFAVDAALAARGEPVWRENCAACHAFGGARTGKVVPLEEAGTDPHRARAWDQEAAGAYNAYAGRYPWDFDGFQAPGGYVSVPLDAVWIRAPYLHNGSVPSLADLLEPPASRPARFRRGCDVYDQDRVGFLSAGPEAERCGRPFDTRLAGNGNGGHLWGTGLAAEERRALLEYLKTL
jgi:mono/diheme cytochrome c family protein